MTKKNLARKIFYAFIILNIIGLIYLSFTDNKILNLETIRNFLVGGNLYFGLFIYTIILIIRGLTIFPGTPFWILGILVFPKIYVILSILVAVFVYTLIINKYSQVLDFKIPKKILQFEKKIKKSEILYIFILCFIPGISINFLSYFLSILKISLRKILIGLMLGVLVTESIYVYFIRSAFDLAL